jgi:5'-phosphate synthase pdxT subunit
MLTVGVLALQGDFAKHLEMLKSLDVDARPVRYVRDLQNCDALILPGGESTAIMRHIEVNGLRDSLEKFACTKPVFGTCAGLIVMSREVIGGDIHPFEWLDISVQRNAFGRQIESFHADVEAMIKPGHPHEIKAIFIRAPRIKKMSRNVKVLAYYKDEPILVQQGHYLGATFHPELTEDTFIHNHFLSIVRTSKKQP